jgi:aryl sulfotransferase
LKGVAREGLGRASEYDTYKSHYTLASLRSGQLGHCFKIIYIVRDPRDVAISAAHHFQANLFSSGRRSNRVIAALKARVNRAVPYPLKRRQMINAVLFGDACLSPWLGIPWRDHYLQFRQSDSLMIKYEDLLKEPVTQCVEILSYLDMTRSDESIAKAISNQSFQKRKRLFESQGLAAEYVFLRRGSYAYWRDELSRRQKQLFIDELGEELTALSYPID